MSSLPIIQVLAGQLNQEYAAALTRNEASEEIEDEWIG